MMTSSACEELNLGHEELDALHACVLRVIELGAEIAIVRARNREVIALAERPGAEWPTTRDTLIARRLRRAEHGVVTRAPVDLSLLAREGQMIENILERADAARWSFRTRGGYSL